ncbi:MAG: hypothetical protein ACOX8I_01645 [Bacillota bacterium]
MLLFRTVREITVIVVLMLLNALRSGNFDGIFGVLTQARRTAAAYSTILARTRLANKELALVLGIIREMVVT